MVQPGDSKPAYEWATIPAPALLPKTIQLGTHQILKLLFAQKESAPTASPISIIIFQDQSPQEDRKETYDVVTSHGQRYNICTPDFYQ